MIMFVQESNVFTPMRYVSGRGYACTQKFDDHYPICSKLQYGCGPTMHSQALVTALQWYTLKSLLFSVFYCKASWEYRSQCSWLLYVLFCTQFFFFLLSVCCTLEKKTKPKTRAL